MVVWPVPLHLWRRWWRADDGAAAVELAIFMPLLLVLVMGAVDFGRVVVTSIAVSNAVKAGAQYGAQNTATSGDTSRMKTYARNDFNEARFGTLTIDSVRLRCRCPTSPPTSVSCQTGTCAGYGFPQAYVVVAARRQVDLFIRYPGFGASVTPSRVATLRAQ